jgi:peptide/nickel transport system permease protein
VLRLILGRLVTSALILLAVSVIVFAGTEVLPGDAATAVLGKDATPEKLAVVREQLNLDRPVPARYAEWLAGFVRGDLGESLVSGARRELSEGRPVTELIGDRARNSAVLTVATCAVLVPLSLLLGTLAAVRRHRAVDTAISSTTLVLISLPEFVLGMLLVLVFAIFWPVLPAISFVTPDDTVATQARSLVLPVIALLAHSIAWTARLVRGSVIEALDSDYVLMARLKGVPERRVIVRHALRNALIPSVHALGLMIGWLVGGIVVVEAVFQYPGIGQGLVNAVSARDLPVVQAIALIIAGVYVLVNLLADVITILLTPKLRTAL